MAVTPKEESSLEQKSFIQRNFLEGKSFFQQNLDHLVCAAVTGGMAFYKIAPHLEEYLSQGHQRALEISIMQGSVLAVGVASFYLTRYYVRQA